MDTKESYTVSKGKENENVLDIFVTKLRDLLKHNPNFCFYAWVLYLNGLYVIFPYGSKTAQKLRSVFDARRSILH